MGVESENYCTKHTLGHSRLNKRHYWQLKVKDDDDDDDDNNNNNNNL